MQFIKHFSEIDDADLSSVGGKTLNLGKLMRGGFPVPKGFCVTTAAYRFVMGIGTVESDAVKSIALAPELIAEIEEAYKTLQTGTVAVRSSATAEDLPDASFAGQQDTFLNVNPETLLDALKACWASLWSERAIAYRQIQGIPEEGLAMAVIIQEMCTADVSGVMFTMSPFSGSKENICIIESNWGLGESVVSGAMTPDNFHVSRETGEIVKKNVALKQEMITASGVSEVPSAQQNIPSLTDVQLKRLAQLGIEVEAFYEQPMDIEWALTDGEFVLLQARSITGQVTTHAPKAVEALRQAEIQRLEKCVNASRIVWSHHNLAEVLPAPFPMTWAIIKEFMSGSGGLGMAYRSLGFYPSKRVDKMGILDLVCGRIYVNLNREAELFFDGFPFVHDFEALKQHPQKAMYAQAAPNISESSASFWFKLPLHIVRMSKAELRLRKQRADFDKFLTAEIFPQFQAAAEAERQCVYTDLSNAELVQKFQTWRDKTLNEFAPQALIATLLAGFSLQRLQAALQKCTDEASAAVLLQKLIGGLSDNLTVKTNEKLWQVAAGEFTLADFLNEAGHRAVGEFELAQPRWREDSAYLEQVIASFRTSGATDTPQHYTLQKQREQREEAEESLAVLLTKHNRVKKQIEQELAFTRRYMPFRETAKFYLMLGYEQIRRTLVELDKRYRLDSGIFYLIPDELPQLINGEDVCNIIAERKSQRELLLQIELPDVLFSDSLDSIGLRVSEKLTANSETYTGTGVSAGVAIGTARVLLNPADVLPTDRDYILVCPSTDPAWTPLFLYAAGLVMERGGLLSHGAVVAREYGVPAVVNIPDATRKISDGQELRVDGDQGTVSIL